MEITVSDVQIQAAMAFYEAKAGKRDAVTICKEVSELAEVLGVMWYEKKTMTKVHTNEAAYLLLRESVVLNP
jgi:hypothetical protein